MKKISYIITKQHTGELVEDLILIPVSQGQHGAEVAAMYFVEDGVYHLVKGGRSAKHIKTAIQDRNLKVFGCKSSIKNRNLRNLIIDGIQDGDFNEFFKIALDTDHIISI